MTKAKSTISPTGRVAGALMLFLALFSLWWPTWPALADLPQHAAQIAWMHRYPDAPHSELFRINLWTPYLFGYGLAWILSHVVSVVVACKLLLTACLLGFLLGLHQLLREVDGDPDWVVLAIPVAVGHPWEWGFLNFLVGQPLLLAVTGLSIRQLRKPTVVRGIILGAALGSLVLVHAYISLLAGAIGGVMALSHPGPWKRRLGLSLPFTTPLPALLLWGLITRTEEVMTHAPPVWDLLFIRPITQFGFLVSGHPSWTEIIVGLILVLTPILLGARPRQTVWHYMPLAGLVFLLQVLPQRMFGTSFLRERLGPLAFVFWLFVLIPPKTRQSFLPAIVVPAGWLLWRAWRVVGFQPDLVDLEAVIDRIPPDQRVLSMVLDREGPVPEFIYLYLPSWYSARQGGVVEMSFARYYPQVVRYRAGADPNLPNHFHIWPALAFEPSILQGPWSYVVLRSERTPTETILVDVPRDPELVTHSGAWWLYKLH